MNGTLLLICIAVALYFGCKSGGTKRRARPRYNLTHHGTGWSMSHVRKHEYGHRNVARAFGVRGKVVIKPDEAYFQTTSGPMLTPVQEAAISYGGRAAAGQGGHEQDDKDAERFLRDVPRSQRDAARREAWRLARRYR